LGLTISPDGARAYVAYLGVEQSEVAVLDTATNTQLASVPLPAAYPANPGQLAVTPDGTTLYVLTQYGVSIIDTASATIVASLRLPETVAIGIIPSIPYASMSAALAVESGRSASAGVFEIESSFTLAPGSSAIDPRNQPVILQVGDFAATVPSGSFVGSKNGPWSFVGAIDGVTLRVDIARTGTNEYLLIASGAGADFNGIANPVTVRLSVGVDSGTALTRGLIVDLGRPINRWHPVASASLTTPKG
jgi:DNA-binding beta-propeller fold protein YncE